MAAQPALSWFCIDAIAVDDIDFSAAATLRELHKLLQEAGVDEDIRHDLEVSGVIDLIGKDAIFETVADVEDAYRAAVSTSQS